jgi:hypothetical protein
MKTKSLSSCAVILFFLLTIMSCNKVPGDLIGKWCNEQVGEIDFNKDLSCVLIDSQGQEAQGIYKISGDVVTITMEGNETITYTFVIAGEKLILIDTDGNANTFTKCESTEPTTTTTTIGTEPTTTTTGTEPTTTTTIAAGERFKDNNNGMVTDTRTGLVWLKNANPCDIKPWDDAVAYCSSLASGQAGLTDGSKAGQWRLPSIQELEGIGTDPPTTYCLDGSCDLPEDNDPSVTWTMPGEPFTNVQPYFYWSGTSAGRPGSALTVDMDGGGVGTHGKGADDTYVWPVRDGN